MAIVNPIIHMDREFMWRWSQVDDSGVTAFFSARQFFFREDCQRDYDQAMKWSKPD